MWSFSDYQELNIYSSYVYIQPYRDDYYTWQQTFKGLRVPLREIGYPDWRVRVTRIGL